MHQHVAQARLDRVLDAIAVVIFPDPVADRDFQHLVEEHGAAADQIQAAEIGIDRGVGRKIGGIGRLGPIGAVGGHVVARQRIAIDHVVGGQTELVPAQKHARERLRARPGRRFQGLAAFRVAAHDRRVQGNSRWPPLGFQHRHGPAEGRGHPVAVDREDDRDLETVVAAAVHHQEAALIGEIVVRESGVENVVDAFDVVVVAVAVPLVGEHVVGPAVHQVAAQRVDHRVHQGRLQVDVGSRDALFFEKHDVVPAGDGAVDADDVDALGQLDVVEDVGAGLEGPDDQVVLFAHVEIHLVGRRGGIGAAAPAGHGVVVVRIVDRVVIGRDAGDRPHLRPRRKRQPADQQRGRDEKHFAAESPPK